MKRYYEKFSMLIAWLLPYRIVMWCFIRVHAESGEAPEQNGEYARAYKLFTKKYKLR